MRTILRLFLVLPLLFLIGSILGTVDSQARMTTMVVGGVTTVTTDYVPAYAYVRFTDSNAGGSIRVCIWDGDSTYTLIGCANPIAMPATAGWASGAISGISALTPTTKNYYLGWNSSAYVNIYGNGATWQCSGDDQTYTSTPYPALANAGAGNRNLAKPAIYITNSAGTVLLAPASVSTMNGWTVSADPNANIDYCIEPQLTVPAQ